MLASLIIQHAMRMRRYYTTVCGMSGSYRIFPHYLINGKIFEKENVMEHKMR
jgi:hypothetical protein